MSKMHLSKMMRMSSRMGCVCSDRHRGHKRWMPLMLHGENDCMDCLAQQQQRLVWVKWLPLLLKCHSMHSTLFAQHLRVLYMVLSRMTMLAVAVQQVRQKHQVAAAAAPLAARVADQGVGACTVRGWCMTLHPLFHSLVPNPNGMVLARDDVHVQSTACSTLYPSHSCTTQVAHVL